MDARVNQLARELSAAISAAVAEDRHVTACREKAAAEGLDLRLSLEAIISFAARTDAAREATDPDDETLPVETRQVQGRQFEMSANDRRFLKSLRISADEPTEKVD